MWNAAAEKVKEVEERISNYLRASGKEHTKIRPFYEANEEKFRAYARLEHLKEDAFKLHQQLLQADKKRKEIATGLVYDLSEKGIVLSTEDLQKLSNGIFDVADGRRSIDDEFSVGVMKREELI